ncbi:hypothetical protein NLN92_18885 [Citrobacter portucalensis]|uniref:hypothetical protein n=1 Tax=Citrobacter portucalensis TaxID=1639133 RepID=UPI00226B5049|nr:hypothetical protein [Citrobacter portucalensis]MCX8980072.1 hypothetical protein [Citrobacter portucalensis]
MFPDNFFTDFLLNVQAVKTEAAREVGNKLMLGVLKLSSRGCEKITTASLMTLTGVSKPQFYYFTNGMSGLWSNILKAALFNHDTLTAEQRVTIVEAANSLNVTRVCNIGFKQGRKHDRSQLDALMKEVSEEANGIDMELREVREVIGDMSVVLAYKAGYQAGE